MLTSATLALLAFGFITELAHCLSPNVNWASIAGPRGDHFPDFSYCGYHNSEIPLPAINYHNITLSLPGRVTDDMAPVIQEAINNLSLNGGGVIRLPQGTMSINAGIQLRSNVVITGSGQGDTTLRLKRRPSKPVFTLGRLGTPPKAIFGFRSKITNAYIPIGASIVTVADGTGFQVGQNVYTARVVQASWVRDNGMSDLVRDGAAFEWLPVGKSILAPNKIKAINGNEITLEIPLADNLDGKHMRAELRAYTPPEPTSEMGIQNLRIEVPDTCSGAPLANITCGYPAIQFSSWTVDSWVRGLTLVGFNKFIETQKDAYRITIEDITMDRNKDIEGTALPADITIRGSQVLVQDSQQVGLETARSFSVTTGSLTPGPNAVTRFSTESRAQTFKPQQQWSWGMLVEDSALTTKFGNRGARGTGRGWAMNAGVGWNLRGEVSFQSPPLGISWCIGCGSLETEDEPCGNATFVESNNQVTPRSLFAAQLTARGVQWYNGGADD